MSLEVFVSLKQAGKRPRLALQAGPTLWNRLPEQFRQLDITFRQFKRSLKTFMFG